MDNVLPTIIGALISGVMGTVIYFMKAYFDGIKEDNKQTRKYVDDHIEKMNSKIGVLNDKYGNVFNELLEKFSRWEDRIKKVMDEYIKTLEVHEDKARTKDNIIPINAPSPFSELEAIMKAEIKNFSKELTAVENDIKEIESNLKLLENKEKNSKEVMIAVKNILYKINVDVMSMKNELEVNNKITEAKLNKMYQICKGLNDDYKAVVKKVELIQELSKTRIKLKG